MMCPNLEIGRTNSPFATICRLLIVYKINWSRILRTAVQYSTVYTKNSEAVRKDQKVLKVQKVANIVAEIWRSCCRKLSHGIWCLCANFYLPGKHGKRAVYMHCINLQCIVGPLPSANCRLRAGAKFACLLI